MSLPQFRYHPDPLRTGSIIVSQQPCRRCEQARGYVYTGPVYSEHDLDDAICPWCIADGSAATLFDALFIDEEALSTDAPERVYEELCRRTPGYNSWQAESWPVCCDDATALVNSAGITELRRDFPGWEGALLNYIVYEMQISGRAALNLMESLDRDAGPTAYLFECLHCRRQHFHVDQK